MIQRLCWTRRLLTGVVLTLSLMLGALPQASADVLVSDPKDKVCAGRSFEVGVWYQRYSGGPRGYRVTVFNPSGNKVFYVEGGARSVRWQYWDVPTTRTGRYTTVYRSRKGANHPWHYKADTKAIHC